MVYAREVNGRVLTLQVSGLLWRVGHVRSLLMKDVETGSLWSHILADAKSGPLRGKSLTVLPAVMTTWADWKRQHPESSVLGLRRVTRGFKAGFYKQPERFVYGVVHGGVARAYRLDRLRKRPLVQEVVAEDPVLVVFNTKTTFAGMYSRTVGETVLSFEPRLRRAMLVDRETGSRWSPWTGEAVAGPLRGKAMAALPGIMSFTHVWKLFHPESSFFGERPPASPGRAGSGSKRR